VKLPTKLSEPVNDPLAYSTLAYGPPKIGKSSLFKRMDYFFIDADQGLRAMRLYKRRVSSWDQVRELRDLLLEGGHEQYKGVVADTIERLYGLCLKYTCARGKVEHPADEEYGKGWERLRTEFSSVMSDLARLPIGVAFLSHSQVSEIFKGRDKVRSRISPKLTGTLRQVMVPLVDTTAYVGYDPQDEEKRVVYLRGTELIEAGTRMEENFRVPKRVTYKRGMNWADVLSTLTQRKEK
jgi:hypothetical protein